jgi:DNA-binding PadR family transcriptional regulator
MRRRPEQLTTGEWAVLALVAERPTHGFALARSLAPGGDVGRVWALRRSLVYRTLEQLEQRALIRTAGTEESEAGPPRTLVAATDEGVAALEGWLRAPVEHVRDARSELMLKLLFLDRRHGDIGPLLTAQRAWLVERELELRERLAEAEGFSRTLALWRVENAAAAIRFVDALSH